MKKVKHRLTTYKRNINNFPQSFAVTQEFFYAGSVIRKRLANYRWIICQGSRKLLTIWRNLKIKTITNYDGLFNLYDKCKRELDIKSLSNFLEIIRKEKDSIKSKLGENTYNNFNGDFNRRILHIWKWADKKYPKYKAVDIAIGKQENNLIHH